MIDYLRLRLRQALRSVVVNVPGRMVAFVASGMVVAVGVQFFVLGQTLDSPMATGPTSDRLEAEVGYAVLLLAALSLATGPQSARFPCAPADVAWVYASPLPIGHLVAAQLVWQAVRRCAFWSSVGRWSTLWPRRRWTPHLGCSSPERSWPRPS